MRHLPDNITYQSAQEHLKTITEHENLVKMWESAISDLETIEKSGSR